MRPAPLAYAAGALPCLSRVADRHSTRSATSTNKRIADEVAIIPSKRLRNKIAGFTTHLMKRIQKGPVRGISFKLQEEERERKDQYVPEVSAIAVPESGLEVDPDTKVRRSPLLAPSVPASPHAFVASPL